MRRALKPILFSGPPGWVRAAYPDVWRSLALAAHYDADQYWIAGMGQVAIDQLQTCTRAATKYVANSAGILVPKAANINPREDLGLLVEQAATNTITNNSFTGAAIGTPGTLPTGWSLTNTAGISVNVAGLGTDNGLPYMDVQLTGTPSSSTVIVLAPTGFASSSAPAAQGQVWTSSLYTKIVAGATTNFSFVSNFINENNSSNVFQSNGNAAIGPTGVFTRALFTRTLVSATTAFVYQTINLGVTSGQAVNLTLRIYGQQLEQFSTATSYIPTTTVSVTRAADVVTFNSVAPFANGFGAFISVGAVPSFASTVHYLSAASGNRIFYSSSNTNFSTYNGTTVISADPLSGDLSGGFRGAARLKSSDRAIAVKSGTVATDSNTNGVPATVYIGSLNGTGSQNAYTKRIAIFSTLTNAQIATMAALP